MRRPRWTGSFSVLLLPALLAGCSKPDAAAPVVVDVTAYTVAARSMTEQVTADAILAPVAQSAIAPKITAPIRKFYVQRGSRVSAGQLLATLENRDLEAAAMDSRGSYDSAEAGYRTTTKGQIPEEFQKAELDVQQARANLNLNQRIVDSRQDLFRQGALPGRDLDTAQAALVQAKAAFDSAEKHLTALKSGGREDAVRSAEGQLVSAKGKYQGAEAQLSYSEIRSPISGVVTDRPLFAGETAAAGTPLLTIMDTSSLIAKTHLPQAMVQQMALGAAAEVTLRGLPQPVEGKVTLISPALDPGSTTIEVWITIANKDGKLKAGTPAHLVIRGHSLANALAIPASALLTNQAGEKTVMVIGADGAAHATKVTAGIQQDDQVQITSGLAVGERIVASGAYGLDDGTKVNVRDKAAKPDADDAGGAAE